MKYFGIDITRRFPEVGRISSGAQGVKITNADEYFIKMDDGNVIADAPLFDYFYLESYDEKEFWEWQLNDVHYFIGKGSRIPGWLISKKLKDLLESYKIAKPHFYYESKLLYKEKKLEYYIFQFSGKNFRIPLTNYIDFSKSIFYDPNHKINFTINDEKQLLRKQEEILEESGFDIVNVPIKKLVLNDDIDFVSMQNFLEDKIVSEKLKQAIEDNGIKGFEFSELDYEVTVV